MMKKNYIIRDYCAIRNQQVVLHGNELFKGTEKQPLSFFTELYKQFNISYPKFYKMDNLCKLGFLTSEILLNDKDIAQRYAGEDIGIILYNAASSVDTDRNHQRSIQDRSAYFPSPSVFVYTLANIVIGEICIRQKIYGESTFFVEKQFDATALHAYVKQLFDEDVVKCCLTGWIELDGDDYEGILYLIEKTTPDTTGIDIFEPQKINEIYLQRS
jgi:hypothetical protein